MEAVLRKQLEGNIRGSVACEEVFGSPSRGLRGVGDSFEFPVVVGSSRQPGEKMGKIGFRSPTTMALVGIIFVPEMVFEACSTSCRRKESRLV